MANVVGDKGQLVIEKPIREALGIGPGFVSVQTLVEDHVEIRFFPPEHRRSLRGVLAGAIRRHVPPEDWEKARQDATVVAAEEWERKSRQDGTLADFFAASPLQDSGLTVERTEDDLRDHGS